MRSGERLRDGGMVYQDDVVKIQKLAQDIQEKWYFRSLPERTKERQQILEEFEKEVRYKFREIGYVVNVDITAAIAGEGPPDVAIVKRVDFQEPDHDHARFDAVKELKDQGKL